MELRSNRLKVTNPTVKLFCSKANRGNMKQTKANDSLYVTSCYEKKHVAMLHSYPSVKYSSKSYEKDIVSGEKVEREVTRPTVMSDYNKAMSSTGIGLVNTGTATGAGGSVADSTLSTSRWPHHIIFQLFDICVSNAWVCYKKGTNVTDVNQPCGRLLSFQEHLIESLCTSPVPLPGAAPAPAPVPTTKKSKKSKNAATPAATPTPTTESTLASQTDVSKPMMARKHHSTSSVVSAESRYATQHLPMTLPGKDRKYRAVCKVPGCGKVASTFCQTCGVALCIACPADGEASCYQKYHTTLAVRCL